MNRQIVEDDHIALAEGGSQLGFDIGIEGLAVDCAVDDPRCRQPGIGRSGD